MAYQPKEQGWLADKLKRTELTNNPTQ